MLLQDEDSITQLVKLLEFKWDLFGGFLCALTALLKQSRHRVFPKFPLACLFF